MIHSHKSFCLLYIHASGSSRCDTFLGPLAFFKKTMTFDMKYLNLDVIKKQCNIDDYFKDDDEYLIGLGNAAESILSHNLDRDLSEVAVEGKLPPHLIQALLLLVAHFYRNRESVVFGSATELPLGYQFLIAQDKQYKTSQL